MSSFIVTPQAIEKLADLISKDSADLLLVVGVRPGGCSGFSYEMYFEDRSSAELSGYAVTDHEATSAIVSVAVDGSSSLLLEGATLSYEDTLQKSGFSIDNPNVQRTCGCGQSFS